MVDHVLQQFVEYDRQWSDHIRRHYVYVTFNRKPYGLVRSHEVSRRRYQLTSNIDDADVVTLLVGESLVNQGNRPNPPDGHLYRLLGFRGRDTPTL